MPERSRNDGDENLSAPVRAFWSGTITFGLVSIPVDLYSAVRPRAKAMRLVDKQGHPLGREYHCSQDGKKLRQDDLIRGYETQSGQMVVITDEEFDTFAPEMSRDIELRAFVPREQIPPMYYDRPYFLAPSGRSAKAYTLLARTMERTGRVGIGTFVMRGHEYLAALLSENGVLRAETLRRQVEIRTPEKVGLPQKMKPAARLVTRFVKDIEGLTRNALDMQEFEDRDAHALRALAQAKLEKNQDVVEHIQGADEDTEAGTSAKVIDLMEILRRNLSRSAQVSAPGSKANGGERADLTHSSRNELYRIASDLDIPGRSKMNRKQLVSAIRRAS